MAVTDPISPAAATIAAASAAVPALTAFGIHLGLRPDVLVAGFGGALVAIVLLNSVPSTGDTWQQLIRTTLRRMTVTLASSITAGYLTPVAVPAAMMASSLPDPIMLGTAFVIGAGAQRALVFAMSRATGGQQAGGGAQP